MAAGLTGNGLAGNGLAGNGLTRNVITFKSRLISQAIYTFPLVSHTSQC